MKLSMTVREFCTAHSISHTTFYELQRRGEGPTLMRVGRKTLVSIEAAETWRRQCERAHESEHASK
jgi:hypothetical protein